MAIRTFAIEINDDAYTKVGDNVTEISAVEHYVGSIKVVVTDAGDAAPAPTETNFIPLDGLFKWESSTAADVWMLSPKGETTIYGAT